MLLRQTAIIDGPSLYWNNAVRIKGIFCREGHTMSDSHCLCVFCGVFCLWHQMSIEEYLYHCLSQCGGLLLNHDRDKLFKATGIPLETSLIRPNFASHRVLHGSRGPFIQIEREASLWVSADSPTTSHQSREHYVTSAGGTSGLQQKLN